MAHELIDIGSNLTHSSFAADLDQVIGRAVAAGVARQVVTGTDLASSRAAADLAARHPRMLWSTAGVHPHHAISLEPALQADLEELLALPQVVAVGECGLDYFRDFSPRPAQRAAFLAQLEIAARTDKPVFLHQRDAHADFTAILSEHRAALRGGVAHCFTEGPEELEAYLGLDLSIGITGWVCDERRGGACARPCRAFHGRSCCSRPTRRISCRAISHQRRSRGVTSRPTCRTSRRRLRRCAANPSRAWPRQRRKTPCGSSGSMPPSGDETRGW